MYSHLSVLTIALVASVAAEAFVHFDIEKKISTNSAHSLQRRASNVLNSQVSQNLANHQEYIVYLNVGTPSQRLGVTLDTGSSDLWIPSASLCRTKRCDFGSFNPSRSSSYQTLVQNGFNITYAAAGDSDAGDWASDSVSINGATVDNQTFGLSNAGYDAHGVLGLSINPYGTGAPAGLSSYSTFVDNLAANGLISRKAYSLYLNAYNQSSGSITFGGIDTTKYTGDLVALPVQYSPGGDDTSAFFVTLSRVTFNDAAGSSSVLTPDGYAQSVLLDSGTSFQALTNDVASKLAQGLGAVEAGSSGGLVVPCNYNKTNATISYTFGGSSGVTVTVPVSELIGNKEYNECSLGVSGTFSGISVLGDTFLRSAYVVYDVENRVVAMAQGVSGRASTSSIVAIPSGTSFPGVTSTASATGTQLSGGDANKAATFVTASTDQSSIMAVTPTFNLGLSATKGVSFTNAAPAAMATGQRQAALVGAGMIAGALML